MKNDNTKSIDILRHLLDGELDAVHRCLVHSQIHRHNGLERLATRTRKEADEEQAHVDLLMGRIADLGGIPLPTSKEQAAVIPSLEDAARNSVSLLLFELEAEQKAVQRTRETIGALEAEKDYVSAHLLVEVLQDEEAHTRWLETQQNLIESLGVVAWKQTFL